MQGVTPDKVHLQDLIGVKEQGKPYQGLVTLNGDLGGDTVETALRKLSGNKILSAPVQLPTGGYVMVDMAGIGYALASNIDCYHQPITTVIPISEKIETIEVEATLVDLIKLLNTKKHHRVIVSKDGAP